MHAMFAHGNAGRVMHDNLYGVMHAKSGGSVVHRNSCNSHGADVRGRTKPLSVSTWCMDRRPAAGELASLHQASGSLHGDAWAGRVGCLSLTISQEVEIEAGCVVTVSHLPSPDFAASSPGPGREVRSWIGLTSGKTERSEI